MKKFLSYAVSGLILLLACTIIYTRTNENSDTFLVVACYLISLVLWLGACFWITDCFKAPYKEECISDIDLLEETEVPFIKKGSKLEDYQSLKREVWFRLYKEGRTDVVNIVINERDGKFIFYSIVTASGAVHIVRAAELAKHKSLFNIMKFIKGLIA